MGLAFGIGLALIIDEAAELIELTDVYWSGKGGVSIEIAFTVTGVVGRILAITHSREKKTEDEAKAVTN